MRNILSLISKNMLEKYKFGEPEFTSNDSYTRIGEDIMGIDDSLDCTSLLGTPCIIYFFIYLNTLTAKGALQRGAGGLQKGVVMTPRNVWRSVMITVMLGRSFQFTMASGRAEFR